MNPHVPDVALRSDGRWGVFCGECSRIEGDYVYPCRSGWRVDIPPPVLVDAAEYDRLVATPPASAEVAS